MYFIIEREPRPDAPYWSGRRLLAAIDAVVWPFAWVWLVRAIPAPVGVVGPVVTALAVLCAVLRLQRAVLHNQRYWFTTWRWAKVVATVWLVGIVMKLSMAVGAPATFQVAARQGGPVDSDAQCDVLGRDSLQRSRSARRQATARVASRTGDGNFCSATRR